MEAPETPPADNVVLSIITSLFHHEGKPDTLQLLSTSDITERIADHLGCEIEPQAVYLAMSNEHFETMSAGGDLYWKVYPH